MLYFLNVGKEKWNVFLKYWPYAKDSIKQEQLI